MSVGQKIKHKTQELKGPITERIGRTTRNRRLQRKLGFPGAAVPLPCTIATLRGRTRLVSPTAE